MHLDRELWQAYWQGRLTLEEVVTDVFLHGLACERCHKEHRAFELGEEGLLVWPREDDWKPSEDVTRQLRELEQLSPEKRVAKIQSARTRFRERDFVVALVLKIRGLKKADDLPEASRWSECAVASAEATGGIVGSQLKVLAYTEASDIHLRLGNHQAATRALSHAGFAEDAAEITFRRERIALRDPHIMATAYLYHGRYYLKLGEYLPAYRFLFRARLLFKIIRGGEPLPEAEKDLKRLLKTIRNKAAKEDPRLFLAARQSLRLNIES